MTDFLYHPDGEGACHEPDEVLRRIAPAFGYVVIDKASGERFVQEKYKQLMAISAPPVILESHRSLFGQVAIVTLADDDATDERIRFILEPHSAIAIEYGSDSHRDGCRMIVEKLALLLGYQLDVCDTPGMNPT